MFKAVTLHLSLITMSLSAHAIFGGHEVTSEELITKSVAALNAPNVVSSSIIIGDRVLLTANHNQITAETKISFGKNLNESLDKIRRIQKVIRHPNLDLALVVLDKKIPAGFKVAKLKSSLSPVSSLMLAGFGKTDLQKPAWPSRLKKTQLPIESLQDPEFIRLDQTGSTGACSGDSGGPTYSIENDQLVVRGILRGVLPRKHFCNGKILYTRVDIALQWITDTIQNLN